MAPVSESEPKFTQGPLLSAVNTVEPLATSLIPLLLLPYSFYSGCTTLLTDLLTRQTGPHCQAVALAIPSTWQASSPLILRAYVLTLFR